MRAPTPTGAAEMAVPNMADLITHINNLKIRLNEAMNKKINYQRLHLDSIKNSFVIKNPMIMYESKKQKLDILVEALQNCIKNYIVDLRHKLAILKNNYILNNPSILYKNKQIELNNLIEKLELVNPLGILKRGYSLTYIDNYIVKSIKDISIDKELLIRLNDGNIITKVEKIEEINNERKEI